MVCAMMRAETLANSLALQWLQISDPLLVGNAKTVASVKVPSTKMAISVTLLAPQMVIMLSAESVAFKKTKMKSYASQV